MLDRRETLPPEPASVRRARRIVTDVMESVGADADVTMSTELLTSEVVTNAIVHGRSGPVLVVEVQDDAVRVAVGDVSPEVPVRRLGRLDDVAGRGVVIVDELATAWGVERERNGSKRVWFEVPRLAAPSAV